MQINKKTYTLEFLKNRFMQMNNSFHFCYKLFLSYKLLSDEYPTQFEIDAPHFTNEFRFAAHFAVIVTFDNFLSDINEWHETLTIKWILYNLQENGYATKDDTKKWDESINNVSPTLKKKIKTLRKKLYAHTDSDFFDLKAEDYLMDFEEFGQLVDCLKSVFDEIYEFFEGHEPIFSDFNETDLGKLVKITSEYPALRNKVRQYEIERMSKK